MNLYRGCMHNCVYCDGRAEKYQVDGEFGEDVVVKVNALDLLQKELDPRRKRTPFRKGYVGVGGGVGDRWGSPSGSYYGSINRMFAGIAKTYRMPIRIPLFLFKDILSSDDLVVVLLEHIDYFLKMKGESSPFGYAAYSISQLKQPLSAMKGDLKKIKGVGSVTERIICEIVETGSCSYYERLARE